MSIFTDHRGQYKKTNIALAFGATMGVVLGLAAIATITIPYWGLAATSSLPLLAAFAVTPLGIGILASFAVLFAAVAGLAIYGIIRNNKISGMEGPKLVRVDNNNDDGVMLQVTREDYKHIYKDNKNKDSEGNPIIDCTWNGKKFSFAITDGQVSFGDYKFLQIKNVNDKTSSQLDLKDLLNLGSNEKERPIDILPSQKVEGSKAEEKGNGPSK